MDPPTLGRTVWTLSFALLFLEVGDALIHFTDTLFLAQIGTPELGAIALGNTGLELVIFPVAGLLGGLQLVIARRVGQNRQPEIGAVFIRGFLIAGAVSIVLAVAIRLVAADIAVLLADSDEVAPPLARFLEIAAFGLPFMALNLAYAALYVALLRGRVLVWATAILVLSNLVLSYSLVLGQLGAPRLGMAGAAIAFVAAEALTFLALTGYTWWHPELRELELFRPRRATRPVLRPMLRISTPIALQGLVEEARWFIFFVIIARVSDELLAWSNVIFACYILLLIPSDAFSEAAYTMVSNVVGAGRTDNLGGVVRRATLATYVVTAPLLLTAVIFPDWVISLFSPDDAQLEGMATALRVVALAMLVVIPAEMWSAAVLGSGDVDAAFLIEVQVSVVVVAGAVAAAVLGIPIEQLWLVVPAAATIALVLAYTRLRSGRWRQRVI